MSVRALARSVARSRVARSRWPGGVVAIDYFGDADLRDQVAALSGQTLSLPADFRRPRTPHALVRAARSVPWDACLFAGGLDNRPALLRRLERRGSILANGSATVARVRDPRRLFAFLDRVGIAHPVTRFATSAPPDGARPWLWKPLRSGGGFGIRRAEPGERRPRGFYLQQCVEGVPGSIVFVADGRRALVLGASEQLRGPAVLGAAGFLYRGSLTGLPEAWLSAEARAALDAAAQALTRGFGLRGLNGLDFVLRRGVPLLLEVNPRYTASMELLDVSGVPSLVDLHLRALDGTLPRRITTAPGWRAKGILYATRSTIWPRRSPRPAHAGIRDRPAPGEPFGPGMPICTLVVRGSSALACRRRLAAAARETRLGLCYDTRQHSSTAVLPRGRPYPEGAHP